MMADGGNNHKRKELDTKQDINTMDNVAYQKKKLKEIHRLTLLPVFDPMWFEHTLGAKAAESLQKLLDKNFTPTEEADA